MAVLATLALGAFIGTIGSIAQTHIYARMPSSELPIDQTVDLHFGTTILRLPRSQIRVYTAGSARKDSLHGYSIDRPNSGVTYTPPRDILSIRNECMTTITLQYDPSFDPANKAVGLVDWGTALREIISDGLEEVRSKEGLRLGLTFFEVTDPNLMQFGATPIRLSTRTKLSGHKQSIVYVLVAKDLLMSFSTFDGCSKLMPKDQHPHDTSIRVLKILRAILPYIRTQLIEGDSR